jgi:hypothetical protein
MAPTDRRATDVLRDFEDALIAKSPLGARSRSCEIRRAGLEGRAAAHQPADWVEWLQRAERRGSGEWGGGGGRGGQGAPGRKKDALIAKSALGA